MIIKSVKRRKGFTLPEVLVVVLIIGILAGIGLPMYQKAVLKTRITLYASQLLRYRQAYSEWKMVNARVFERESDLPLFWDNYLDNGQFLGLKDCEPISWGSPICHFSNGQAVQVRHSIFPGKNPESVSFYFLEGIASQLNGVNLYFCSGEPNTNCSQNLPEPYNRNKKLVYMQIEGYSQYKSSCETLCNAAKAADIIDYVRCYCY